MSLVVRAARDVSSSAAARLHWRPQAPVAQGIERCPAEAEVACSNHAGRIFGAAPRGTSRIRAREPHGRTAASAAVPLRPASRATPLPERLQVDDDLRAVRVKERDQPDGEGDHREDDVHAGRYVRSRTQRCRRLRRSVDSRRRSAPATTVRIAVSRTAATSFAVLIRVLNGRFPGHKRRSGRAPRRRRRTRSREVGDERLQLIDAGRAKGPLDPLRELVDGQPACSEVSAERASNLLALGVGRAQGRRHRRLVHAASMNTEASDVCAEAMRNGATAPAPHAQAAPRPRGRLQHRPRRPPDRLRAARRGRRSSACSTSSASARRRRPPTRRRRGSSSTRRRTYAAGCSSWRASRSPRSRT